MSEMARFTYHHNKTRSVFEGGELDTHHFWGLEAWVSLSLAFVSQSGPQNLACCRVAAHLPVRTPSTNNANISTAAPIHPTHKAIP